MSFPLVMYFYEEMFYQKSFFTKVFIHLERGRCLELRILERTLVMSITISDELLTATRMNEGEMKQEIAVLLFQKEKV